MTSPMKPFPRSISSRGGFSLIEVTMAMGVLFFAAISMLGLLSVAAGVSQKATSVDLARRVSARIFGDVAQAGLSMGSSNAFFDIDGNEVAETDADRVFETWYSILPGSLPGSSVPGFRRVVVQVFHNPGRVTIGPGASGLVVAPRPEMEVASFQFHLRQ